MATTTETTTTDKPQNLSFILEKQGEVRYEDRPVPELKSPYDVLIQVAWTGICGSDIHYWQHGRIGTYVVNKPMVLGHESAGVILEVGSAVTTLKPGDRVAMEPGVPCYHCPHCKSGFYNLCADMQFAATPPYDGTLAKYYTLPADFCYKLPEHVSLEAGALVEPASVAVHIVKQGAVKPGDNVVVFGAGPVGLLCAGVSKAFGAATVTIVDVQEARLEFAKGWVAGGCSTFLPTRGPSAVETAERMKKETGLTIGADVVLEATGAPPCIQAGIEVLRMGGRYVQAGMGGDNVDFPIMSACCKEIILKGSFRYGEGDYKLAVELIAQGKLDVEKMITGKVAFGEAEKAYADVKAGKGIKILIEGFKD